MSSRVRSVGADSGMAAGAGAVWARAEHLLFEGLNRSRRVAHLAQALEQNLPGAGERGHRKFRGHFAGAFGLARTAIEKALGCGRDLDAGQEMHRLQ